MRRSRGRRCTSQVRGTVHGRLGFQKTPTPQRLVYVCVDSRQKSQTTSWRRKSKAHDHTRLASCIRYGKSELKGKANAQAPGQAGDGWLANQFCPPSPAEDRRGKSCEPKLLPSRCLRGSDACTGALTFSIPFTLHFGSFTGATVCPLPFSSSSISLFHLQ